MEPLEAQLSILIEGMIKKEKALIEILSITDNQNTVIESELPKDERMAFIVNMNREKQDYIQTVIDCDNLFERLLKEIGPDLDSSPDLYKPQVAELQVLIRKVMDLDVSIRVREDKNNDFLLKTAKGQGINAAESTVRKKISDLPSQRISAIHDENRIIDAYKKNAKDYTG